MVGLSFLSSLVLLYSFSDLQKIFFYFNLFTSRLIILLISLNFLLAALYYYIVLVKILLKINALNTMTHGNTHTQKRNTLNKITLVAEYYPSKLSSREQTKAKCQITWKNPICRSVSTVVIENTLFKFV